MPLNLFPGQRVLRDPITTAIIIGGAAVGGSQIISSRNERKSAEKAASAQDRDWETSLTASFSP